jgi:hypothetical protein
MQGAPLGSGDREHGDAAQHQQDQDAVLDRYLSIYPIPDAPKAAHALTFKLDHSSGDVHAGKFISRDVDPWSWQKRTVLDLSLYQKTNR